MDTKVSAHDGANSASVVDGDFPAAGAPQPLQARQHRYLQALIEAGLLIPGGVDGVYGRSAEFEAIVDGLNIAFTALGVDQHAEVMRFPPGMSRNHFEKSEYLKSFPQLAGTVHSFYGNDRDHHRLLARLEDSEEWADEQRPTRVVLTPAACYPIYPVIARRGVMPPEGCVVDAMSYCFRHEPSLDPMRMQMFRQREYVRLGNADQVIAFRQLWIDRGRQFAALLELPHEVRLANDPFFGRCGKIVADSQRELKLKFELLVPIHDGAPPSACMSFNYHMNHFAQVWALRTADGAPAHTGCAGFGLERMVLALLRHHGFDLAHWPKGVRATLGGM